MPMSTRRFASNRQRHHLAAALAACSSPATSIRATLGGREHAEPAASTASRSERNSRCHTRRLGRGSVDGRRHSSLDLLPNELGGEATQKHAFVGDDLSALDAPAPWSSGASRTFLVLRRSDMTIGTASNSRASIIAIRVTGKSAQEVSDAMIAGRR